MSTFPAKIQELIQQHMFDSENRLGVSSQSVGKQTANILAVEEMWKKKQKERSAGKEATARMQSKAVSSSRLLIKKS